MSHAITHVEQFAPSSAMPMLGSASIAALVTIGIFAGMHALIKSDGVPTVSPEPLVFTTSIMDDITDKEPTRTEKKPPPEPRVIPERTKIIPNNNNDTPTIDDFSYQKPNISPDMLQPALAVDQQPRPVVRVNPSYPNTAARDGIEGFVTLSFSVNSAGVVENVEIIDAKPTGVFERNARRALRKWKYQPKMQDGNPVAMHGLRVTLDFTLSGS